MEKSLGQRLADNSFWLSVLLHLLLFLLLTSTFFLYPHEQEQRSPQHYVPSYVYKGAIAPSFHPKAAASQRQREVKQQTEQAMEKPERNLPKEKNGLLRRSIMSATQDVLHEYQQNALRSLTREEEPIYLVGDENFVADPLIKMMGRAISAHFEYPRVAGELGIKGRVLVGLTLHPEGTFSDVQMLKSSENMDLDNAALYAVNSAPKVYGADRFISQPKHFVVGFIFR